MKKIIVQFKGEYAILVCGTKKMSETTELKKARYKIIYSHKTGMKHQNLNNGCTYGEI